MRTSKDIDFTQVDFITYAVDEYLRDIPIYELATYYVDLFPLSENTYQAILDGGRLLTVNTKINECYLDGELMNGEDIVRFYEGENVDPAPIIKRITGIDLDDYISDVTYKNGITEYLDVKGKQQFTGGFKKVAKND